MDFNALQDTLQGARGCATSSPSIESKYDLLAEIGRGSYGVVWQARQRSTSQIFAVKQVSKRHAGAKGLLEVVGEVETMSLLSHPNIVRLEETFQDAESLWIVMEYLPGGELQQIVKARELSEATTRRIVTQLLMAIEYIHDKGIVHRDLKPANCLVVGEEAETVKISDFGFAVLAGADQCLTAYCGTVAFMAPEILLELNYGKPVDMWALGVMTYYLVTGEYPFVGSSSEAMRRTICRGKCNLTNGRLKLFPLLGDFLNRLFTRDPLRRLTAKEALKHPWVRVGREDNAGAASHYLSSGRDSSRGPHARKGSKLSRPRTGLSRWRGVVAAIMAAHRLCYLQRCRRLTRLGYGSVRLLRDFRYSVSGVFDAPTPTLDCSRMFAKTPPALTELLPMVQSCRTITALDLSHNNIESLSLVQALLKVCAGHPTLAHLNISHNPIPAVAGRGLLRLARNPLSSITCIEMGGTLIPEDTATQVATLLREKALPSSPSSPVVPTTTQAGQGGTSCEVSSSSMLTLPTAAPQRSKSKPSGRRVTLGALTARTPDSIRTNERHRSHHAARLPPLPLAAVGRRQEK